MGRLLAGKRTWWSAVVAAGMLVATLVFLDTAGLRAAGPPTVGVVSIGDSNFNYTGETFWGTEWPTAISGSVLFSRHIDADSGRSITRAGSRSSGLEAVAANANVIADADIVLVNLGVNDSEEGAAWRAAALSLLAAIRSHNATVEVYWITPVAQIGVAENYLVERAADHASTLRDLRSAGQIDGLVEWDDYATAHPEVFHSDGIHFWLGPGGRSFAEFTASSVSAGWSSEPTTTTQPPTTQPTTTQPTTTQPTTTTLAATTTRPPTTALAATTTTTTRPATTQPATTQPAVVAEPVVFPRCGSDTLPWAASDHPLGDTVDRTYLALLGRKPTLDEHRAAVALVVAAGRSEALTESLLASSGPSIDGPAEAVVDRLYLRVLRRPADSAGLRAWSAALRAGTSPQQLAHLLIHSPESIQRTGTVASQTSRQGMVCRLYLAGLGRVPDADGLAFWSGAHDLRWVADAIAASDEFTARFAANAGDRPLITSVYRNVLGRAPDPEGLTYWQGRLTGGLSRGSFVLLVSNSPEFIVRTATVP